MKLNVSKLIRFTQIGAAAFALLFLCWVGYEAVIYVRLSPMFEVKKLTVTGLKRIRESQVQAKAGFELGTNVFRVDLDEIRNRVEELDWVRYAAVQRVLPDEIVVRVVERMPIGVTRIKGESYQFDIDGTILDIDADAASSFPVLDGLRADPAGNLTKVQIYQNVLEQIGQTSLSEIHINDSGDVSVVSASEPVLINLGTTDFHNRWIKYLQLKPQIQQRYPQALRVDLRFKNQVIIKMKDEDVGEKIVWGAKKDTL